MDAINHVPQCVQDALPLHSSIATDNDGAGATCISYKKIVS